MITKLSILLSKAKKAKLSYKLTPVWKELMATDWDNNKLWDEVNSLGCMVWACPTRRSSIRARIKVFLNSGRRGLVIFWLSTVT